MHIKRKGSKDTPISDAQQRRTIASPRPARIEHVFAGLAQMGGKALRFHWPGARKRCT
jgi:hypothetical protein